jgi:two-component system response regulator GlrR
LFRAADRGVVFLDEVGDLPMELQAKLVRVLLDREVYSIGEAQPVPVDVRVLSSTHADLEARVAAGTFRDDLYYLLKVVALRVPSLEERREDIPLLVAHQLKQLAAAGFPKRVYSPDAMELLVSASWPGNVRQLFNVVEHNVALSPGRVITGAMVRTSLGEQPGRLSHFDEARSEFARKYLRQLLELTGGNISKAARLAGRNRTDFYKLLGRYQIDPAEFKTSRNAPDAGDDTDE